MSIIKATIRGVDSNDYRRLGISRRDLNLFDGVKDLEIIYQKKKIKVKLGKTFGIYQDINHRKIREWSGNKLSNVEIDIRLIKKGKIKIIKIMPKNEKIIKNHQKIKKAVNRHFNKGDLATRSQIVKMVRKEYPEVKESCILPSDYCDNCKNKDPRSGKYKIFHKVGRGVYKII